MHKSILVFWKKLPGGQQYLNEHLEISRQSLFELKKSLKFWLDINPDVKNLTKLDLSNSRLEILPEEIKLFKRLKKLILSNNRLISLPEKFNFEFLELLDLRHNPIARVPNDFNYSNISTLLVFDTFLKMPSTWKKAFPKN